MCVTLDNIILVTKNKIIREFFITNEKKIIYSEIKCKAKRI